MHIQKTTHVPWKKDSRCARCGLLRRPASPQTACRCALHQAAHSRGPQGSLRGRSVPMKQQAECTGRQSRAAAGEGSPGLALGAEAPMSGAAC
eukprot:352507-Chlamydomonas_euryale.AAC.7